MSYLKNFRPRKALYESFQLARKNCNWKTSVQRFALDCVWNVGQLSKELRDGTYTLGKGSEFFINERGKLRKIKALTVRDRVVQRSLCDNVLLPCIQRKLIYDNGASIRGKGLEFSRNRLVCHLQKYFRKFGREGYILKVDFSKFFDNIDHAKMIEMFRKEIPDEDVIQLIEKIFKTFRIPVNGFSDDEIEKYIAESPINLVKYKVPKITPETKFIKKSVGIGSQISQVCGVFYPTPIDNYCKIVRSCKYYGRYMDDIYIIDNDKEKLKSVLGGIRKISKDLKLFINEKKTQIIPLRCGFTFLQIKYSISETGKITARVTPKKITRERRKLKAYRRLYLACKLPKENIINAYSRWRGTIVRYKCKRSVGNIDTLFKTLFPKWIEETF